jgi:acid phosphatase (class A)
MKKLLFVLLSLLSVNAFAQQSFKNSPAFYLQLKKLSSLPSNVRAWMDTIAFPWAEYGKAALANSLLKPYYLTSSEQESLLYSVTVPANSSEQTKAELQYLIQLQETRTAEEIAKAQAIANVGSSPLIINPTDSAYAEYLRHLFYIAQPLGNWYNPDNFPATTRLLMNCIQDIRATEFHVKRYFKRPRPYHLEPALQPLARISSPSFASGHSLWAYSQAYLFGEIVPSAKKMFLARAAEVRWSREIMGIHFPSDNDASIVLSQKLLSYWMTNPRFVADLEQAKIEWSKNQKF